MQLSGQNPAGVFSAGRTSQMVVCCLLAGFLSAASASTQMAAIKTTKLTSALLQDVAKVGDRLIVVGERGHIGVSKDNGATWEQAEVPVRQMLNAVYFPAPAKGWAVGYDEIILATTDGGMHWVEQLDGTVFNREQKATQLKAAEIAAADAKAAVKAAEESLAQAQASGAVTTETEEAAVTDAESKLDDANANIEDLKESIKTNIVSPLMDVWFRDENLGFAVGAFNSFLRTRDGGKTWEDASMLLDNPDSVHLNAIAGSGDVIFIAGEGSTVFKSVNAGESWELLPPPDAENGSFFAVNVLDEGNEIFVMGLRGAIYRSVDQGVTWVAVKEDLGKNMNAAYISKNGFVAVGNDGAVLISRDGGQTFTSKVQENRLSIAGVAEASNGDYILVGVGGLHVVKPSAFVTTK